MKLSAEQIAQIKSWISKRGFTHTDVQYEIIDHVASAIEDKMEEKPQLSLEEAFSEVHKSFGVFGFQSFEESIANRLNKELLHSYWSAFKTIVLSTKIIIPLLIFVIINLISQQIPQYFEKIILGGLLGLLVFTLLYIFRERKSKKYLKSYLSFKMASAVVPLMAVNIFNLRFLFLDLVDPIWTALIISILVIAIWAVYLGSHQMIRKTEKLHLLYH
jgi:4-amino-4-deoxy-L-arabinose transferase-like glycosyltransferase